MRPEYNVGTFAGLGGCLKLVGDPLLGLYLDRNPHLLFEFLAESAIAR